MSTNQTATATSADFSSNSKPPLSPGMYVSLSLMMFLQYGIWGAWLPLFFAYLTGYLGITPLQAGELFSIAAIGALFAPFIAGQIADRWFNTEKFLGLSHLVGAALVWKLAGVSGWWSLAAYGLLYSLIYAPTLALSNALAFHHLPDRDRDFGRVRVWGTIGWIVVGIGVGQWLYRHYTPEAAPIESAWLAGMNSVPASADRADEIRKVLLADESMTGVKNDKKEIIKPGVLQNLVSKKRANTIEQGLDAAIKRAAASASAASKALQQSGWSAADAEIAATRVTTVAIRQELALRAGDQVPADIDAKVAAAAAKAVQTENQTRGMSDSLRLSGVLGIVLGIYCFFLPKTPPRTGKEPFAAKEALQEVFHSRALIVLFIVAFPIACVHQFYFIQTAPFLNSLNVNASAINNINKIFGVGGGGLMTIGQISEFVVLALVTFFAKRLPRKILLTIGLLAYIARFAIFAYMPEPMWVIPALALHGVCFGCFFFICFMIVDELTTKDVRASAQGLFNLVLVGLGTIVGNLLVGFVGTKAARPDKSVDYQFLFSFPMWIVVGCLVVLLLFYPMRRPAMTSDAA